LFYVGISALSNSGSYLNSSHVLQTEQWKCQCRRKRKMRKTTIKINMKSTHHWCDGFLVGFNTTNITKRYH
jgi:hypothetical protein